MSIEDWQIFHVEAVLIEWKFEKIKNELVLKSNEVLKEVLVFKLANIKP